MTGDRRPRIRIWKHYIRWTGATHTRIRVTVVNGVLHRRASEAAVRAGPQDLGGLVC